MAGVQKRGNTKTSNQPIINQDEITQYQAKYPNIFSRLSQAYITKDTTIVFIIDIDDTLVKTMQLIFGCFKDSVKNLSKVRQNELIGKDLKEFTDRFLDENTNKGKIDTMVSSTKSKLQKGEELASSPRADYDTKYKDVGLMSGAVETLQLLNEIREKTGLSNIKIVLYSNNYMDNLVSSTACRQLFPHADVVFAAQKVYYTDEKGEQKYRVKIKGKPFTDALKHGLEENKISVAPENSIFFGIGDRKTDITVLTNLKKEEESHIGGCFYLDTHSRAKTEAKSDTIAVDAGDSHIDIQEWTKLALSMIKDGIDNQENSAVKAA